MKISRRSELLWSVERMWSLASDMWTEFPCPTLTGWVTLDSSFAL